MTYSEFQQAWKDHVELFLAGQITHEELEEFGSLDNFMRLTKEDRQEELERYFAKYDNPDQELKGSRTYQMLCKNIDQMTHYLERCPR